VLLPLQLNQLLSTPPTLVEVPDVVGQTQASGTAELEAVLFVVAVETAYSSIVAAGNIISQSPLAGVFAVEGSTVTITVSLGEAASQDQPSGGFFFDYDRAVRQQRRRKREREEAEEEAKKIQDALDREIAELLHKQEAKDAERADLERIQVLADKYAGKAMREGLPRKVSAAILKAQEERSFNALQQMQREINRMLEEEEVAVIMALMLD
jgi:Skp family chaperone for outer membrane proteins